MEIIPIIVLIIIILLIVYAAKTTSYNEFIQTAVDLNISYKGLSANQKNILVTKFPYYAQLTSIQKYAFEKRLKYFLANKEFIAKDMPEVTDEMKILVGASAVQLTFGYAPLKFAHFSKIILFPGRFYSKGSNRLRIGEVNPYAEVIVLSWKDFIKGYTIPGDGYNVGLHEMAHALKVEDATPYEEYAFLDDNELQNFYDLSQDEFHKIRNGKPSFFRSYAGTNMEEFFAVAVEYFFEQPVEFKKQLPDIYASLSRLLHQNPAKAEKLN